MLGSAGCAVAPPPVTPVPSSLSQAHRGIKGMVVDKFGKPVRNARVSVKGIRHDVTAGELLPELAAAASASTSACRVPGLAVSPSSPCPRARRVPGLLGGLGETGWEPGSGLLGCVSAASGPGHSAPRSWLSWWSMCPRSSGSHRAGKSHFSKMTGTGRSREPAAHGLELLSRVCGLRGLRVPSGTSQPIWRL